MRANGAAIRAIRVANHYKLRAFAAKIKLNPGFLSQVETGKRQASDRTILRIATGLQVPVEAIIEPSLRVLEEMQAA